MVYAALVRLEFVMPALIAIAFIVWVVVTAIGLLYMAETAVGVVPSVVYLMAAPGVAQVMITFRADVYVPPAGLMAGVAAGAAFIVYAILATAELFIPLLIAIALIFLVLVTAIGPLYTVDLAVGVVPFVVYLMVAPRVAQEIVTF
jgi:hypothetical protein